MTRATRLARLLVVAVFLLATASLAQEITSVTTTVDEIKAALPGLLK